MAYSSSEGRARTSARYDHVLRGGGPLPPALIGTTDHVVRYFYTLSQSQANTYVRTKCVYVYIPFQDASTYIHAVLFPNPRRIYVLCGLVTSGTE